MRTRHARPYWQWALLSTARLFVEAAVFLAVLVVFIALTIVVEAGSR
jgi:hypothetical protein